MSAIDFQLHCPACGTSLLGTDFEQSCPGCSARLARFFNLSEIDSSGSTVSDDLTCLKCAYNIGGQPIGSACPGCGAPIIRSIQLYGVETLTHESTKRFRRCVNAMILALLIMPAGALISLLIAIIFEPEGDNKLILIWPMLAAGLACLSLVVRSGIQAAELGHAVLSRLAAGVARVAMVALCGALVLSLAFAWANIDRAPKDYVWFVATVAPLLLMAGLLAVVILILRRLLPPRMIWRRRLTASAFFLIACATPFWMISLWLWFCEFAAESNRSYFGFDGPEVPGLGGGMTDALIPYRSGIALVSYGLLISTCLLLVVAFTVIKAVIDRRMMGVSARPAQQQ